jgi:diguanylate cyclase (GGDEF)-like protein
MHTPSAIRKKTLVYISVILLFALVIGYILLSSEYIKQINRYIKKESHSIEKLFAMELKQQNTILGVMANYIANNKDIEKAVSQKDRQQIAKLVSVWYKRFKILNPSTTIFTIRSKENITLYRAHKPEFYGDTLQKSRHLILDTAKLQRSLHGFEIGKLALTYRKTVPLFYKNQYIGTLEIGVSPEAILEKFHKVYNSDFGLIIKKQFSHASLHKHFIPIDNNDFYLDENNALTKIVVKHFIKKEKLKNYRFDMHIPLKNYLGQEIGNLLIVFNIKPILQQNQNSITALILFGALFVILLLIILYKSFNLVLQHFIKQTYTDSLTKLPNREALDNFFNQREEKIFILSNIKDFSMINELYGTAIGNYILKKIAQSFKRFAKENQLNAYRVSSDEFALTAIDERFNIEKIEALLQELHNAINGSNIYIKEIDDTLSVEIYSGISYGLKDSLEHAKMALKKAKIQALPYLIYSQNIDTKQSSHNFLQMKNKIKYAIEYKNIVPFFQPITDKNSNIIKYEALVRIVNFQNNKEEILYPEQFLPVSMKSELYIDIEKEMLRKALDFFAKRKEAISVNFLPNDLFNQSLMDIFTECLKLYNSPKRVIVEITEQEDIEDFEKFYTAITKIKKLGVCIAIDDFGTGYANYTHILKLKPDYLKIDASLIKNILTDKDSQILVKSITSFADYLGIKTIAEYVENEEIFTLLKEYDIDEFQGYYFGAPENLIARQQD